ncbi:MAG: LytTR family DNA-binding domain-containing protein [Proteobacteria bacterium]|nr:LytTR family DNA-binding domain-containing protein [Pseudomonadota bacterium]
MAEPLRLLVVDDEPPARARLVRLLAAEPGVQVVGEAEDGLQALALAARLQPDALLLDVQMPEVGGLDVAASLPDDGPAVVFVTAFDDYAVPAFDAAAVDYLLKPVDPARLAQALQRLRRHRRAAPRPAAQRLVVVERGQVQVIARADVLWLQAADNYVDVHTAHRQHLLRRTLEGLLADLGPGFVRIHRSRAVALSAVVGVDATAKGDASVRLSNGATIGCSRAYRAALVDALR